MRMRQKPIIFTTIFEVTKCEEPTVISSMCGDIVVEVGDYIFQHPDGIKSRVKKESIHNFEVVG
jgi:hypothetical protein